MNKQVRLRFFRRAERQFLMRAVQRVAGLECNHFAPTHLAEIRAQLVRRVAATTEVVVHWLLDTGDRTTEVDFASLVVQVVYCGMGVVICAKYLVSFIRFVRFPAICNRHRREDNTLLIAKRDVLTKLDGACEIFGHVQSDRHGPKGAVCKTHVFHNTVVIFFAQETFERVKTTVHQKL